MYKKHLKKEIIALQTTFTLHIKDFYITDFVHICKAYVFMTNMYLKTLQKLYGTSMEYIL